MSDMAKGSICRNCFHSYVCEQFNENKDDNNTKCHFANGHYVPAADVVPKSEVEQIFKEIEEEIQESLNSNYRARPHIAESEELYHMVEGKITALSGMQDFIAEIKKKYIPTEGE